MALPLTPPVEPQLAKSAPELPRGEGWIYEPKWDGFRVIAFVDDGEVFLQSRGKKPLQRYFPELALPRGRYVLDGEIVILDAAGAVDFGALQNRIHPAESRVARLAEETPVTLMPFDLLAVDDEVLLALPFAERRARLAALAGLERLGPLSGSTDPAQAEVWLQTIEGVVAKELQAPYRPGKRLGMVKVKRVRSIDTVVVGYRPGVEEDTVGSLILGLYDGGEVVVIGHSSGFSARRKRELLGTVRPYETGQRGSGDASRWTQGRELEWVALRPELVAEVTFDHASGGRIRHGARLLRFRDDKAPAECVLGDFEPPT